MSGRSLSSVVEQLRRAAHSEAPTTPDGQLLQRFIAHGDREAVASLVHRHGAMVWGVCRRVLGSEHDAEDAFQATFLVLIRRARSIWPRELVANWLYGVARQTALKARAMTAKRRARERRLGIAPNSSDRSNQSADTQCLEDELGRLPAPYRIAVVLCDLEGRTRKEAACLLGWPEGTVAGRLARARRLLAKRLAQRGIMVAAGSVATVFAQGASACVAANVVAATIAAVSSLAVGQTVSAGVISGKVAALTEGVLRAMFLTKLKKLTATVVILAILGIAGNRLAPQTSLAQGGRNAELPRTKNAVPAADDSAREHRLHGIWKVLSLESDGAKARFESNLGRILPIDVPVSDMTWTFADDRLTIQAGKHLAKAAYSVDTSKKPHRLDLVFEVDLGNEEVERVERITVLGIWSLERDQLTVCLGNAGTDRPFRPLRFASSAGSSPTSWYVLRRFSVLPDDSTNQQSKAVQPELKKVVVDRRSDESLEDRAWRVLGFRTEEVRRDALKRTNEQLRGGLLVDETRPGSLADQAGFRVGDILVGLHHWEILSLRDLFYCWDSPALDELRLVKSFVVRDNNPRFLHLSRPAPLKSAVRATANFEVHASDERTAKLIGDRAEELRKSQALAWLGQVIPTWHKRCRVHVQITPLRDGSCTFSSDQDGPIEMHLKGSHDRLRYDELPLQLGHAILYHDLGMSAPRWAGAGMGMLDGSEAIRQKYMKSCRELSADGGLIPLRKLLPATEFPRDMTAFYPQSLSLTHFLVARKDRATFLAFVGLGMRKDWDSAIRRFYGLDGVEGLETTWQKSLSDTPKQPLPAENRRSETIRGLIEKVDRDSGLLQLSVGSDSGLGKGETLEVFRLKPAPQYLGMIRSIEVQPRSSIGRRLTAAGRDMPLQPGDQVASRISEQPR